MTHPETSHVPVAGGELFVARWGNGPIPVLAVHGISANHAAWLWLADRLGDDYTLIAPDLRGRGASGALGGPFGMAAHAADMVAVLDHFGYGEVILLGHSMGAFVVEMMAVQDPARYQAIVLVDGGVGRPLPEGTDPDVVLAAVLGPALQRLDMTFDSERSYFDFWREHPVFSRPEMWTENVERYFRWDLGGDPPSLRSRASAEAVMADGRDLLVNREVLEAPALIEESLVLLRATRGLLDEPEPLIPDDLAATFRDSVTHLDMRTVPDTDHYSIVMSDACQAIAAVIADQSTSSPR